MIQPRLQLEQPYTSTNIFNHGDTEARRRSGVWRHRCRATLRFRSWRQFQFFPLIFSPCLRELRGYHFSSGLLKRTQCLFRSANRVDTPSYSC